MLPKKRNVTGTIVSGIVSAVLLIAAAWVIINRQYVSDQIGVWLYKPTPAVATIAERSGMAGQGKFYFYASQPTVNTADEFNQNCAQQETGSAILGCYSSGRVYIYDVPNTELDGVEEVTAAHETLHAVWERMSDANKKTVGTLLEAAYSTLNDPALNERMAYYERTEPGERLNELHSILGTEYANIGADLEAHYKTYFSDRSKVVALHASYQAVFDGLKAQATQIETDMTTLKATIDAQTASYNTQAAALSADAAALQTSAASVDRTSAAQVNAYNAKRQALLNRIAALELLRQSINTNTQAYNEKVTAYNALIVSANELSQSLDSTLVSAPSL